MIDAETTQTNADLKEHVRGCCQGCFSKSEYIFMLAKTLNAEKCNCKSHEKVIYEHMYENAYEHMCEFMYTNICSYEHVFNEFHKRVQTEDFLRSASCDSKSQVRACFSPTHFLRRSASILLTCDDIPVMVRRLQLESSQIEGSTTRIMSLIGILKDSQLHFSRSESVLLSGRIDDGTIRDKDGKHGKRRDQA